MSNPPPPVTDATSLAVSILDGLLVLAAICILAYIVLRYGLGRLRGRSGAGKLIQVVDRVELEPRRALYAVRVGKRAFLIGASEGGMRRLAELDADELPEGTPAPSVFEALLRKKTEGEGAEDDAAD